MAGPKEMRAGADLPMHEIGRAQQPLRMAFWGWILLLFEISSDGFDLLNDVAGAILVTMGVFRLSAFAVPGHFPIVMRVVRGLAVVLTADAVYRQLQVLAGVPHGHWMLDSLSTSAELASLVAFAVAMMWLSCEAQLERAASSWKTTTRLMIVSAALELGLGAAFVLAADDSLSRILARVYLLGSSPADSTNELLGAALVIAVIVTTIAVIHFLMSTGRMRRAVEAEDRPPVGTPTPPTPRDSWAS